MARHPRSHPKPHDQDDEDLPKANLANEETTKAAPRREMPKPKVLGKITWLGEGEDGPRTNSWNGVTFKAGEAVEVSSPYMLNKAKTNRFYEVVDNRPKDEQPKPAPAPERRADLTDLQKEAMARQAVQDEAEARAEAQKKKA